MVHQSAAHPTGIATLMLWTEVWSVATVDPSKLLLLQSDTVNWPLRSAVLHLNTQ